MLPSIEEINQHVLEFLETHEKDPTYNPGHNFYYAFTVDENDNICQERYGTNLMTRRAFFRTFKGGTTTDYDGLTDFESEGFTGTSRLWIGSGDNTIPLSFTDEHMREKITYTSTSEQSVTLKTGYYNPTPANLNVGYLYQTYLSQYGVFDYQLALPDDDSPSISGHTGGTPEGRIINESTVVDTRWLTDESDSSKHYFNITEIGLGSGGNTSHPDPLTYHMILRDENGNPSPIRKYYNQKLFIYVYFTDVVPVKPMADGWGTGNYLLYTPSPFRKNNQNVGIKMDSSIWQRLIKRNNLLKYDAGSTTPNWNNYCVASGYLNTITRDYSENNGNQFVTWSDFKIPELLIEDSDVYVTNIYFFTPTNNNSIPSKMRVVLTTFDELDAPEEIVAIVSTNSPTSDRLDDQFGKTIDYTTRDGMLPMLSLQTLDSLKMFNTVTNTFDIEIPFYFKLHDNVGTFFNMTWMKLCTEWTLFACPDGVKRNVYVYYNYMAENGGYKPYQFIDHFTNIGITLFASDTPWNINTWTQFYNINDCASETDTNDNLLVKKRYFICYSDVDLSFTFKDDDYPKIVTTTTNIINSGYNHDGMMIGDDTTDHKYIVIGSTLIKLNNDLSVKGTYYQKTASNMSPTMCGTYGSKYWYVHDKSYCTITIVDTNPTDSTKDIKYLIINALKDNGYLSENSGITHTNNDRFIITEYKNNTTNQIQLIDLASTELQTLFDNETITTYSSGDWERNGANYQISAINTNPIPFEKGKVIGIVTFDRTTNTLSNIDVTELLLDSDKNALQTIRNNYTRFTISDQNVYMTTDENVKYFNFYTSINLTTETDIETQIIVYDNPATKLPIINNARKGFCIQGTNLMVYNDTTDQVDMHKWNIIDMTNPLDDNGDPNVIDYFTINTDLIGDGFKDGMGFGSHVYVVILNKLTNTYSTFYYDITSGSHNAIITEDINLNITNTPGGTNSNNPQYVGNEDCLIIRAIDNGNLYIIANDNPLYAYTLTETGNNTGYGSGLCKLQLKEIDHGDNKKQLLLTYRYCRNGNGNVSNNYPREVYDIGYWLLNHEYPNGSSAEYFKINNDIGYNYCMLFDNNIVTLDGDSNSNTTSQLILSPIARWIPIQLTGTTKCIQAFNNPILLSGKSYTWQITNHMGYIGLSDDGVSVYEE